MPRSFHRLVARAFWFAAFLGAAGGFLLFLQILTDSGISIQSVEVDFWTVLAALALTTIGFIVGAIFLWQFIGHFALKIQGWPFEIGESVEVLTGEYAGTVAKIYEIWEERSQVRLSIGNGQAERVEDVFAGFNVTRIKSRGEQVEHSDA